MLDTLFLLPASFWVVAVLLLAGLCMGWSQLRRGTGLPIIAVLGTVAIWYVVDVFYNRYQETFQTVFSPAVLDRAWWEVVLSLVMFLFLLNPIHVAFNRSYQQNRSWVYRVATTGVLPSSLETQLASLLLAAAVLFSLLSLWAAFRLGPEIIYYFFPYLGHKAEPWARDRIGQGIDALISLAGYVQVLVASVFGVVAALSSRRTRRLALAGCFLIWPYYFFDRTRSTMLLVALPGILSWVFLRLRVSFYVRLALVGVCFLGTDAWFKFVIANRSEMTITQAFKEQSVTGRREENAKHEGLNMYEELCWVNHLMEEGTYQPNWGERYFAEIVNPIPRSLWPSKPLIGIDYAVARGVGGGQASSAGVVATFSTGMVGQGVVNFGPVLGPAFVGLLMSVWVALLARLDLTGDRVGRLPLYALGLVLTFNAGRDITLLNFYPFLLGWAVIRALPRLQNRGLRKQGSVRRPGAT